MKNIPYLRGHFFQQKPCLQNPITVPHKPPLTVCLPVGVYRLKAFILQQVVSLEPHPQVAAPGGEHGAVVVLIKLAQLDTLISYMKKYIIPFKI